MSSATDNKNGAVQNLAAKAPWTDEQGIAVKIYEGVMTTLEVLMLLVKMTISFIHSMYLLVVPPEPKSVEGDVILITGAGHGMGREMALRFGKLGGVIVCVDVNAAGNQETVDMVRADKGKVHRYECDVTDSKAVAAMAERVRREVGEVTMLINNAGIMPCKTLDRHSEKEIRTLFEVNVLAHFWMLQNFLPSMMERNRGHIVAMSSMAGTLGLRNLVPYCSSKFAVRGMMEALHEELREDSKDYSGIKFTTICPYIVDTGLCKNPKIRFPQLMKIVTPGEAADSIVDAVRRNYFEITIPSSLFYINLYLRPLPRPVPTHLKDFLDSGVDAH